MGHVVLEEPVFVQPATHQTPTPERGHGLGHLWMGGISARDLRQAGGPLVLSHGDGIYLSDEAGNRYIDAIASLEAVAVGHGRREIAEAVARQYEKLEFFDTLRYTSAPTVQLAEKLGQLAPDGLDAVHFACSGSEAVEAALKIARQFHVLKGNTSKYKVIARRGSYHGCTFGAMSVDGGYYRTQTHLFEPLPPLGRFVRADADPEDFSEAITEEGPETVSAIIIDPLATASGIYPKNDDFWSGLRAVCDRYGVLLIADEVITGFGRTGRWFASGRAGVAPDLITVSKALTSGYFPISAVIASQQVASAFEDHPFAHGHTFGGHPVAAAAAIENLRIIEAENLVTRSQSMGEVIKSCLEPLRTHTLVADIRGEGLLYGIELSTPEDEPPTVLGTQVVSELRRQGALTFVLHPGSVLFLCPPLIITEEQCAELVGKVAAALDVVARTLG